MEINAINNGLRLTSFVPNIQLNNRKNGKVTFGYNLLKEDAFQNHSVTKFFDETEIKNMISSNSEVKKILSEHNIPLRLNMKELQELKNGHCQDTQNVAMDIVKYLPPALKQKVDIKTLKDGALLHDFGKVLIPTEVLNKNSSLTPDEHKIMDLHSELGYQLLKNSGVDDDVLNLVRNHHNISDKNGFVPDINLQILNLADKYAALTEKRVYKEEFSPEKALTIISGEVNSGEIHPFLFNALVKSVQDKTSNDMLSNVK